MSEREAPSPRRSETTAKRAAARRAIDASARSDRPADADSLDRARYVEALAALIANKDTEVPLTIGIYGTWGSGKSSFMRQLSRLLARRYDVVQFNPWRYPKTDELWVGLIAEIAKPMDKRLSVWRAFKFLLGEGGAGDALHKARDRAIANATKFGTWLTLALPFLAVQIHGRPLPDLLRPLNTPAPEFTGKLFSDGKPPSRATLALFIVFFLVLAWKALHTLMHPFATQFAARVAGYQKDATNLRRLTHVDLGAIATILASEKARPGRPIVVVLDDLDRCRPDRVVDVLEAVSLFFDGLPFVTVMGLDPRVVARAVADKYAFLIPKDASEAEKEAAGRAFLEKIIQIPFQLPPVKTFTRYLERLIAPSELQAPRRLPDCTAEVMAKVSFYRKPIVYVNMKYLGLMLNGQAANAVFDEEWRTLEVMQRLSFDLPLHPEQLAWLQGRPASEQALIEINIDTYRNAFNVGKTLLFNVVWYVIIVRALMRLLRKLRDIREQARREAVALAQEDGKTLAEFSGKLRGNPRSVKRFLNNYRLAMSINGSLDAPDGATMGDLAAWLVLLQSWPIAGAVLHRQMGNPSQPVEVVGTALNTPPEMGAFVEAHFHKLDRVAKNPKAHEIAGCFSYLSPE